MMYSNNVELWQVIVTFYIRYLVIAGGAYFVLYVWKKNDWLRFKIQQVFPSEIKAQGELAFSLLTLLIFAAVIYSLLFTSLRAETQIYLHWSERNSLYNWLSLPVVILLHDTYFYWLHRFMHVPAVFKWVHKVHHESRNPTPLAAFSFHPLEAVLEIAFLPLLIFFLPVHRVVLAIFGLYMILMNIWGHLGFEFLPNRFMKSWLSWLNTSTGHNMHHQYGHGNYGLYFNLWDRWMGTNHSQYREKFNRITDRAQNKQPAGNILLSKDAVDPKKPVVD